MTKLLLAITLVGFAALPAQACDWNRQASSSDPAVATTATPSEPAAAPTTTAAPATSVASEESARKPADRQIVLITDRH